MDPVSPALIIEGLALSLIEEDLAGLFMPFGALEVHVAKDRFGRSLGFGYVVMETERQATEAIQALQSQKVAGQPLKIIRPGVTGYLSGPTAVSRSR
jgi:RNA recognition motif-containing protein